MSAGLIVILPPGLDDAPEWLRVKDGAITARGRGEDWGAPPDDPGAILLVVPAAAITLHRAALPDLAPRQARAAARLLALENSLGGADDLHVATGPRDAEGGLDIAVVRNADMVAWLLRAQRHGLDPAAVIPAALLLPRPPEGFVAARIGGEALLRDASAAFADDGLGALLVGDAPVETLTPEAVDAALVAALAAPPLNLRQGAFTRRRAIDRGAARRSAILAALIVSALLATALVRIARLHADTAARDAAAVSAARAVAPEVTAAPQAEAAVNALLAARGLGGRGFSGPAAALLSAMQGVPGVSLTALARTGDGALSATLAAAGMDEINTVLAAMRRAGYRVTAEPPQNQGGRSAVAVTVAAP